jgi:hypothetical protein
MANPKRPKDTNVRAKLIVEILTGEKEDVDPNKGKNPKSVKAGALGGAKGGKARAKKLSAEKRKEIAKKAAEKRWKS